MFGVGWQEILVIFLVLLIFVGPKRIPDIARSMGKALRDFARAKEEVRRTIEREFSMVDDEDYYLEVREDEDGDVEGKKKRSKKRQGDDKKSINRGDGASESDKGERSPG